MEVELRFTDCLICSAPGSGAVKPSSDFTPEVFHCLMKLLNLHEIQYSTEFSKAVLCLDCGVKLEHVNALFDRLDSITEELQEYRVQVKRDLSSAFFRTKDNPDRPSACLRSKILSDLTTQQVLASLGASEEDADDIDSSDGDVAVFPGSAPTSPLSPRESRPNSCEPQHSSCSFDDDPLKVDMETSVFTPGFDFETGNPTSFNIESCSPEKKSEVTEDEGKCPKEDFDQQTIDISIDVNLNPFSAISAESMVNSLLAETVELRTQESVKKPRTRKQIIQAPASSLKPDRDERCDELPVVFACSYAGCTKSFPTHLLRRRHVHRMHSRKDKAFPREPKPRGKTPEVSPKGYECEKCGKYFRSKSSFGTHRSNHDGFRFICKFCGKGFRDKVDIEAHEAIHTGEFPFKCVHCGAAFRRQKQLRNHKLQKHEEYFVNGKSVLQCDVCDVVLSSGRDLKNHKMKHTGDFPYRCEICGAGQVSKSNLNNHLKIHQEDREFQCSVCEKSFKFNNALVIHMKSHTGERSYQCKQCPKNYMDPAALRKHVRAVHNDGGCSYVCHLCGKENPSSHYLNVHLRSHRLKEIRGRGVKEEVN